MTARSVARNTGLIMLVALVFATGCTPQPARRFNGFIHSEKPAKPEHLPTLQGDGAGAPGLAAGHGSPELPAPHPIDLPETHPANLPDAEPCPSHPRDLPIGEPRAMAFKSISAYQVQYAHPIYVPAVAYQYLIPTAYKPPTVNEVTGVKTYYPMAPGVVEMDALKAAISYHGLDLTRQQLERTKNDLTDAKLELLALAEQLRDLEIDVRTLKGIVGELIKRKQVP